MKSSAALAVALLAACPAPALAGPIHTWVDGDGRVHFGDRLPPGVAGKTIAPPATPPAAAPADAARRAHRDRLLESFAADRAERAAAREQRRSEARRRLLACAGARSRLSHVERANLLYRKGNDGTREYLDEASRNAAIERLRGLARHACRAR